MIYIYIYIYVFVRFPIPSPVIIMYCQLPSNRFPIRFSKKNVGVFPKVGGLQIYYNP